MTKKKKYIPGWQTRQVQQDRQLIEKAKKVLDEYYDKYEQAEEQEEPALQQPQSTKNNKVENNDREESERTETNLEYNPAQQRQNNYGSYVAESPESYFKKTLDQNAFKDQFIPSVIDPNYQSWLERQKARGYDDSFVSKAAKDANTIEDLFKKSKRELFTDKMNRRIKQNEAFGKINKNYQLTNEEVNEIVNYRNATDPLYLQQRLDETKKYLKELQALDPEVEKPSDYFGKDWSLPVGMGGSTNVGNFISNLVRSAWAKSFVSDFMEESNSSQLKVSVGQIQRADELLGLSGSTKASLDLLEEYSNNLAQLQRYNDKNTVNIHARARNEGQQYLENTDALSGLSADERNMYGQLLYRNREIRQLLEEQDWWKTANNLASWAPTGIPSRTAQFIDKIIDDDLGGIRGNLYGLDKKLDNIQQLLYSNDHSQGWLDKITKEIGNAKAQLNEFDAYTNIRQDGWRKQSLVDAQDLSDWRTGDNMFDAHLEVDPYYKQQKTLLERSNFDWSDPVKMAQFGWSGIAGGSNSSWWKSIISTASTGAGIIGGAATTGGLSTAIQAGAMFTTFEAQKSASSDENNIEANEKTKSSLRSKLISSEKYTNFIKEGEEQINKSKNLPELKQLLETSKDEDKKLDAIMDAFLAGMWHSKDPQITKMHADAVIGTNNQFYNNQPAVVADAAVDAIVGIANLEPVKYFAHSTKLIGRAARMGLKKTAAYKGFEKGIHNAYQDAIDSRIAQLVKTGAIKTGNAASKIPMGAVVGSAAGIDAGYAASDGSIYGAAAGGVLGGVAGGFAQKGIKMIGVEPRIAKAYQATRAFATKVPSAWMKASSVMKPVFNVSARLGAETASEMLQEGIQARTSMIEPDYDVQHNRDLADRIFEDLMYAKDAAWIWMNQNSPEMRSEAETYSQMNATPLLTLFGINTGSRIYTETKKGIHEYSMIDAIQNNIDAERRANVAELEQGKNYAKFVTKEDREQMKEKFAQFKKLASAHEDAKKRVNPSSTAEQLMEEDDKYIPQELIDEQEKDYEDIYALANSERAKVIAVRAKVKFGSDDYAKIVSMLNFRRKKRAEAFNALKEKDSEQSAILGQNALEDYIEESVVEDLYNDEMFYGEGQMDTNLDKKIRSKNDVAKALVHAATLMEIVDDYSSLQNMTNRQDVFLSRAKAKLQEVKKNLKSNGFNVETQDDVFNALSMSEEGSIIESLIDRAFPQDQKPSTLEDHIRSYMTMLRERELAEFDFLLQDQLLTDFENDPNFYINVWDGRLKADQELENILESDYVETIRDYESAASREVKDGDIYVGDDGYWYITKKIGNNFEKHRYHPNSRKIDSEALQFNPLEYDRAKKSEEEALARRDASKKANQNIQTGNVSTSTVEETAEASTQEEHGVPEGAPIESPNEINVNDYVSTPNGVGKVIAENEDGSLVVQYGAGRPELDTVHPASATKITSPIENPNYSTGDIIEANDGKKYTVGEVYLESINPDTYEPKYTYDLIDVETGDVLASQTEEQINNLTHVDIEQQIKSTVKPNKKQEDVIQILEQKKESDKKATELSNGRKRRSGHDYFIKLKGRIQRFVRVHGVLDNLFEEDEVQRTKRRHLMYELSQLYEKSKKDFQDRVVQLQEEYNQKVANKYGKDSSEYDYYAIDLSFYIKGNILNDPDIVSAISSILCSEQPGPAVVVGSIIDEIARDFFNPNVTVQNKKEYRMSDVTFNSIISQLNKLQERFDKLGWVVDTHSYTWYGKFKNGVNMAGETDMIAIDKQGNVHILDFKTTSDLSKFDTQLQYKTKDLQGNDVWMPITKENLPEGAEVRMSTSFLDDVATKEHGTVLGKRTYAAQYARQLEAYRLLIQQTTGRNVTSLEVIPFAVEYGTRDSVVTRISNVHVYDPVNLTEIPQLQSDLTEIDNYLNKDSKAVTTQQVESVIDDIQQYISEARAKADEKGVSVDTIVAIHELIERLNRLVESLSQIKDDNIKLADSVYTDGLFSQRDELVKELNHRIDQANEQISIYNKENEHPNKDNVQVDNNREWLNEEPEEVMPEEKSRWWHFNSLHSYSEAVKTIKNYIKNNIKSDFIKNSTFVITRDDKNDLDLFSVTITYRGMTFGPIMINIGKNDACPNEQKNQRMVMDQFLGAMGRNFLRQYYQLVKNLKPGEQIVATKVTRTNGTIRYAGKNKNLTDTQFLSKNDPRLLTLINGKQSLIGVSDGGIVVEVGSGNREAIDYWKAAIDLEGNVVSKKIRDRVLPGNSDTQTIPDGVVIFFHVFKNEEDPEDMEMRSVPLVLQGKTLGGYDGALIAKILIDIANSKTPTKSENELFNFKVRTKDGKLRDATVPGLTNMKVLKLLTRFGQQAEYANDEFIFDYAREYDEKTDSMKLIAGHKKIRITDMRATATENSEGNLHRRTIDLDLRKKEDVDQLLEILSLTQMHINQMGTMRANLNTDNENSPFGALRTFFLDESNQDVQSILFNGNTQIDVDDVFPDKNDPSKGLTGIAWAIKHGYAATNAESLENPIISIHELGVQNKSQKEAAKQKEDKISKEIENGDQKPRIDSTENQPKPHVQQKTPTTTADDDIEKKIAAMLEDDDLDIDTYLPGGGRRVVESLRPEPISNEEKQAIEKRLRRLVGNVAVNWTDGAVDVLKNGAQVAGRTAVNAFKLSNRLVEGTESHEAFHRIFEILIPNNRRQKMYDVYRAKYNDNFKRANGRDLTDRDISEDFAEMFRLWVMNKHDVKLHWNILKTFKEINDYIEDLKNLGDYRFAALFMLANSGIFRFVKPNKANTKHFLEVLGGEADMRISAKDENGNMVSVNLDKFPAFGGRSLFNDAVSGIIFALCQGYSIDMLASNAARLKTSRNEIAQLFKGKEQTKHSSWFRVLTGEYVTSDEKFTIEDANTYYRVYKTTEEIKMFARQIIQENPDIDKKQFKVKLLSKIYQQESARTEETLNQNQKMMAQLFDEKTWWIVEKKINNKLAKMSIDSERVTEEEYKDKMENGPDDIQDQDEESLVSKDVSDHKDEFYDHARTDDATGPIRFFLSSIPDERFATQEDVELGIVRSTTTKDGDPVTISNSTNLLGYQQFLSMKIVSNKLLLACHDVSNVRELDERLQKLASTDPIFYRIARKYRSALNNEVLHTPDGKNKITLNGKIVPQEMYEQGKDEFGWYYTWNDAGENPGQRIEGAVTQTNPDMESFVTQLFNYVACQKLDFIMVTLQQEVDSDGDPVEGSYTATVRSSDSDYAASVYPASWFARLRGGVSGIFKIATNGTYTYAEGGKKLLSDAISTLKKVHTIFQTTGMINLNGKVVDKNTEDGFRFIESEFINALNTLGIDITREALEYYLQETFGNELSIRQSFGMLISRKEQDTSFAKFVEDIDDLKNRVTDRGENSVLSQDTDEETVGFGRNAKKTRRSGSYIYSQNGFVKWMSRAVSRYNKAASEIMTNGPEGTKRYILAQSHTASDITDNYNKAELVDGEIKGSRMLKDMRNYLYNTIEGIRGIPKGSIIIKQLFFAKDKKLHLVLHTHGGVKVDSNHDGGVSYRKITEREDWIAKAAILKQGGIIFPTLSDKSTWFYLTGATVPGINYGAISQISPSQLLHIGLHQTQKANSSDVHVKFDFTVPNAQLDQMIEYAECERAFVEREINRGKKGSKWELLKKLPFIEFFDENRKRFGGLSEVVTINENGNAVLTIINDYNKSPEDCLKTADQLFFSKTTAQKRQIMALTLEEGFMRNIAMLERAGLISASNELKEQVLDETGNPTGKTRDQNRLMQYKNIGLDSEVINALKSQYISEYKVQKGTNISLEQAQRAESQAICAYVWDIYLRGVISNEEVEHMYTGQSHFFKWKHSKIKDAISGKELNVLTDRHSDESKRLGGLGSTGDRNRTDLANMRRTYKCAEIEDQIVKSKLHKELKQSFIDNYVRDAYITYKENAINNDPNIFKEQRIMALDELNDKVYAKDPNTKQNILTLDEIKKEFDDAGLSSVYATAVASAETDASAYEGDINVADGAALITPKMAKDLLRQRGRFTSKVKQAFDILEGKVFVDGKHVNPLSNRDAYLTIMDALIGAQKYSAYGYRIDESTGDIPVHYYNKYALQPLFPQMATGFTADVLKKMESEGIDMLMMHSAVKTGSQGAVKCTPDMFKTGEEFKNFKFNTYNQDFAFIRRQLNTDPHERSTVAMGTQMTKIALSNLKKNRLYYKSDGTTIRGRDLLADIMNAINELSNLGKKNIEKEFFTDGQLDYEKFSAFLESELERRDADANLLDGIEVVTESDGTQHFKVPLEAMSSVDWIQSIIVSKINREVCDINVKGNAFYQRSVWGMEGHPKVLDDAKVNFKMNNINDGEDLNIVNEDGSMDAVISYDYFYDIVPAGIRDNFNKGRQWLIDHKIIGKDAKANTIASRIPTQAQSSISALRFVDVLPVVRDTIILPKEFTKTTGSDFDIDKLYLVTLSYNVRSEKIEDKTVDTVDTNFAINTDPTNYFRNKLIENYLTLLKSHGKYNKNNGLFENGDSIHISMRSIDDDTNLIKSVLKRIEKNRPVERSYAYKFGNIAFQVATKAAFMIGKFGIGPFALNNNSQILTQLYGVKFSKSSTHTNILDSLGCLDLSNSRDKQNKSILSWLSGLINAHVDVAKDPYIRRLNINTFTYNLTNLLIRTGMGERTLLFTAQPVMVELARVYDDASGSYMVDVSKSKSARQRQATKDFIIDSYKRGNSTNGDIKFINEMLMGPKNSDEDNMLTEEIIGSYAQAIFGIDSNGQYTNSFSYIDPTTGDIVERNGCILEDILTNPEVLESTKKGYTFDNLQGNRPLYRVVVKTRDGSIQQVDMSPRDVQLYVYFIQNALSKYGQKLSDLVNACKIDTKKQGKSYVEQRSYMDKYEQLFDNSDGLFEDEGLSMLKEQSYIDVKTKNATELYERILSEFSIQSTAVFKDTHDRILTKLNSSAQNKQLSKKVTVAIMTWLKGKFFDDYIKQRGEDYFDSLFYGKNSIQSRLIKLQNEIKKDKTGKFSKFGDNGDITLGEYGVITNPLLKALQPDVYEKSKGFNNPLFVKLENALLDDSDNMNALERAWDELYRDTYHYTVDEATGEKHYYVKEFAEDLAVYAFLTSGDKNGTTKFFKCVPNTIRTAMSIKRGEDTVSYADYMASLQDMFTNGEYQFSDEDINDIIGQNWQDNDFVKQIKMTISRNKKRIACHSVFGTITTKSQQTVSFKKKSGKVGFRKETLVKTINLYIAGVKKTTKGSKESIHRCNDDRYPAYVKLRRPTSTKYDPDNYLLYKFKESRQVDPTDPNSETYPIYELVTPSTCSIRAGSYEYQIYNFDKECPAYPTDTQEILTKLNEDVLTSEQDRNDAIKEFAIQLNNMGVSLANEELEDMLIREFEERGFEYTNAELKAAVKWIKDNTSTPKEGGTAGKRGNKKTKKVEKKEEAPAQLISENDVFGEGEDIELGTDEKQRQEKDSEQDVQAGQEIESISEDDLDPENFEIDPLEICKNAAKNIK